METQTFKVANVKCGGCVANIKNGLSALDGVASVEVELSGEVTVVSTLGRAELAAKLAELGYPEVAE